MQTFTSKRRAKKREGRSRKGEGSVYQRGGKGPFYYKIPNPHGEALTGPCKTQDYNTALLVKQRALVRAHDALPKPAGAATITEILKDYENYCESDKPKSWKTMKASIGHLREYFGTIIADALTTLDTDQYRDYRAANGCRFSTINRELGYLKAALRREMNRTPARVTRIPFMRIPSEKSQVREGFIEREDYERILAELPASLKAIFVCAFHTGARSGELKNIRWSQINWRQRIIELTPKTTKNSEGRWLPIWGDMEAYLREQKAIRDRHYPSCEWVFFWHPGHHPRAVAGDQLRDFRFAWEKACERAGLKRLLFHDLRRSAIRFADQEAGLSQSLTMLMSGHKTDSTFRRYNIRGGRDASKIGKALDEALERRNTGC
jgi:integrase